MRSSINSSAATSVAFCPRSVAILSSCCGATGAAPPSALARAASTFSARLKYSAHVVTVTLPWPPRALWPNTKAHWSKRAPVAAKARADAMLLTRAAGWIGLRAEPIPLRITFHPPNRIRRDLDGMLSAMKPALDGVAAAMGVDDHLFRPVLDIGEPVRGGAVIITMEANQ